MPFYFLIQVINQRFSFSADLVPFVVAGHCLLNLSSTNFQLLKFFFLFVSFFDNSNFCFSRETYAFEVLVGSLRTYLSIKLSNLLRAVFFFSTYNE